MVMPSEIEILLEGDTLYRVGCVDVVLPGFEWIKAVWHFSTGPHRVGFVTITEVSSGLALGHGSKLDRAIEHTLDKLKKKTKCQLQQIIKQGQERRNFAILQTQQRKQRVLQKFKARSAEKSQPKQPPRSSMVTGSTIIGRKAQILSRFAAACRAKSKSGRSRSA